MSLHLITANIALSFLFLFDRFLSKFENTILTSSFVSNFFNSTEIQTDNMVIVLEQINHNMDLITNTTTLVVVRRWTRIMFIHFSLASCLSYQIYEGKFALIDLQSSSSESWLCLFAWIIHWFERWCRHFLQQWSLNILLIYFAVRHKSLTECETDLKKKIKLMGHIFVKMPCLTS